MTTVSNTKAFCLDRNTPYKDLLFQSWLLLILLFVIILVITL